MAEKPSEQELYMQVQMMQQQINQMEEHINQLDEKVEEAKELKKSIQEFKDVKIGDEILVPVTNGIFAKAKLLDNKEFKVNVGSGVVVTKSIDETLELVDNQVVEIKKIRENSQKEYQKVMKRAEGLMKALQ